MNDRELTSKEIAEIRLKYPPGTRLMLIIMEDSYAVPTVPVVSIMNGA